jgi:hypothetical protein
MLVICARLSAVPIITAERQAREANIDVTFGRRSGAEEDEEEEGASASREASS